MPRNHEPTEDEIAHVLDRLFAPQETDGPAFRSIRGYIDELANDPDAVLRTHERLRDVIAEAGRAEQLRADDVLLTLLLLSCAVCETMTLHAQRHGLEQPNWPAQIEVVNTALRSAGVTPNGFAMAYTALSYHAAWVRQMRSAAGDPPPPAHS